MSTLPTGTVTFLFTDIESSTKLWEQHPTAMQSLLARHDAILRQAVEANQGQIVKTTGDGIHAVFGTVAGGIAAACAAQQALQAETWQEIRPQSLRVRMGLHTGEAEFRAGDYYGSALNRAARLMALGVGGQLLISNAAADLVREALPAETSLLDLGEHRLKDLARPEHVYQLVHPALRCEFPPLQSLDTVPNNLPVQLTSFIGREKDIAEILNLLGSARLVTLTGPGGTGKTRLALEASAQALAGFAQGAWLLELAPLANPSQIVPALAQVFGLKDLPSTPLNRQVEEYLRDKKTLLILDNCEHLIEACAHLADDLLHQCAHLKIIASSREALGIAGEMAYRIPSLEEAEAAQLFLERAWAAHQKFQLNESNAAAVARICARLDGIPLAIELAAARVKLLTPEQIATRLDDRFRLLIGGSRTALPRQQTLRALIDWSYDLLGTEEKRLLRITSVFVGGWSLDALETVAEDPNTLEHLEQLVNKSLVVTEEFGNEMRYSLLETIRQYGREKLLDAGVDEAVRVRNLHLDFFLKLTQVAEIQLTGPEMIDCLNQLEMEQDNLRVALEWAIENDPLATLQMVAVLATFWGRQAFASEGYAWVQKALIQAEGRNHLEGDAALDYLNVRAKALHGEAVLAFRLGQNNAARTTIDATIALARQIQATKVLASALGVGAIICAFVGDLVTAQAWVEESIDLSQQYGYAYELALTAGTGMFMAVASNRPIPPGLPEEALRIARSSGNPWALALAISNVGRIKANDGYLPEALSHLEEAGELYQKLRDQMMYTAIRSEIGHIFRKQGRFSEALEIYRETIRNFQKTGQWGAAQHELECFAFIAQLQNQNVRSARLLGAAETLREQAGSGMTIIERREYDEALDSLRAQMDGDELTKAWTDGRSMTMEQAIEFALQA